MSLKMIFLVGAPISSSLDWDADELLNTPLPPFYDIENPDHHRPSVDLEQSSVKWRVLQPCLEDEPNHQHVFYHGLNDPNFLTTRQLGAAGDTSTEEDSILSMFYSHSFAIHENTDVNVSISGLEYITQEGETVPDSMRTSTISSSGERELTEPQPSLRMSGPLSDLQDIPTARHLESIVPQTMTVNLIVGIIAIYPPRRVVTRQWKTEFDIIEMVVGDETRTGFGMNFWLPSEQYTTAKTKESDRLGQALATLRPQDIVLLRTVALSSFQGRVYGQTLRGGMTQVDLLHRRPEDETDADGSYQASCFQNLAADQPHQKARRVREWVLAFVGGTDQGGGHLSGMSSTHGHHRLPPDTQ
ncbi:hypothetical protein N7532_008260 [Penicillium argentinense]|uniref:Uncharacterized protein n=1 Tax=Penicillium argentinense TaxID=1131581 RepID=A0A9W9EXB1_9EURO|nr:uncharacterized protein N7532_008260 [Penicillium argentinense]KAJ5089576.1 hypothetical protein N7532_008260 [Penicillium argentinense]